MDDCRSIERDVPALIDGDLGPRRAVEVQRHLAVCPACEGVGQEYRAVLTAGDSALAYQGNPLAFSELRARMATIEPLEQIIRYELPKLKIPGTAPRFAVAMVLLVSMTSLSYACRHTREVYVAVRSPFEFQQAALTAALEEGRFPGETLFPDSDSETDQHRA